MRSNTRSKKPSSSWEAVASWYNGWVGKHGSHYHRKVAVPTTMELLSPTSNDRVLDLGAGSGVLAPHVAQAGAAYVGVELSPSLIKLARRYHGEHGQFIQGDVRHLSQLRGLQPESFQAAAFLLSIQDMDPLDEVVRAAGWALAPGARLVIFMVHPCFRMPRQSGWGYDPQRKLNYRRVDRYLSPTAVPMKAHDRGVTKSYHRPLERYVQALVAAGFRLDRLLELPDSPLPGRRDENPEIPLFLALRGVKS